MDSPQLSLDLGLPPLAPRVVRLRPDGDRVFFAVMPPPDVAETIAAEARRFGTGRGLRVDWRPPRVLHVSLTGVGMWDGLPPDAISRAIAVGAGLVVETFAIRLSRTLIFGKAQRRPLVLCCDEAGIPPLAGLSRSLDRALVEAGRREAPRKPFVPHLTLGYTRGYVEPARVEAPVGWMVRDFVLVRSPYGETRYDVLGRWPLAEAAPAAQKGRR